MGGGAGQGVGRGAAGGTLERDRLLLQVLHGHGVFGVGLRGALQAMAQGTSVPPSAKTHTHRAGQ